MKISRNEWKKIVKERIYSYNFKLDKNEIIENNYKNLLIFDFINENEMKKYDIKIAKKIDILFKIKENKIEINNYIFRILCNNLSESWDKNEKICCYCRHVYNNYCSHLMYNCDFLNEKCNIIQKADCCMKKKAENILKIVSYLYENKLFKKYEKKE